MVTVGQVLLFMYMGRAGRSQDAELPLDTCTLGTWGTEVSREHSGRGWSLGDRWSGWDMN